jgi:hypothetical protein
MLQGSLENFALDEVLGLLSGTSKTGQLEIAGDRGTGSLMFYQGRLVDGTASYSANGTGLEDVMFELLRYEEGTFTFSLRDVTPGTSAENVASVLANAEARLRDWRSIEAVVPSLSHQVTPVAELPAEEVTIDRHEWAVLTVIASGCPVSMVCEKLELGEVEGSRQIKNLAERELVNVSEPISSYTRTRSTGSTSSAASSTTNSTAVGSASANGSSATGAGRTVATPTAQPSPGVPPTPTPAQAQAAAEAGSGFASVTGELAGTGESSPAANGGPALGSLMGALGGQSDENGAVPDSGASLQSIPPSPAEIAGFSQNLEDASELVDPANDPGGILSRYLRSED